MASNFEMCAITTSFPSLEIGRSLPYVTSCRGVIINSALYFEHHGTWLGCNGHVTLTYVASQAPVPSLFDTEADVRLMAVR